MPAAPMSACALTSPSQVDPQDATPEKLCLERAAQILGISQPALSKQITELEEQYRLHLFVREKGRIVELTDAGRVFVQEARASLFHAERAIHLAHAAHQGVENVLLIGHSHYA